MAKTKITLIQQGEIVFSVEADLVNVQELQEVDGCKNWIISAQKFPEAERGH